MAVPEFEKFLPIFLDVIQDGGLYSSREVRDLIIKKMEISEEDLSEMVPSGKQSRFNNRMNWARTYLDKAGLIETPSRGKYRITEVGKQALASGDTIDVKYLDKFDKFKVFHKVASSENENINKNNENKEKSPIEVLESAFQQVNSVLIDKVMDEVMKLDDSGFEKLIVKLLLKMGYGSGIKGAGIVTPKSHDGGIDGVIKEDQLGFSNIYIQAKQWAVNQAVSRPEIQKFVGALQGKQAQKGLFITTASFSAGAKEYAGNLLGTKVVLVDGDMLARLMIKHNVGVSVEQVYEVKKIDTDFFIDEL